MIYMDRPYVGIIVSYFVYNGIQKGKTGYENLSFYEEAGELFGFIPCFFRLSDIVYGEDQVIAYVKDENNRYLKQSVPIPKVIHNRGYTVSKRNKINFQWLIEKGTHIFNKVNRYRKLQVHKILKSNPELRSHIPKTRRATPKNILQMLETFNSIIIKPNYGSLGSGVMLLSKNNDDYTWIYQNNTTKTYETFTFKEKLPTKLLRLLSKRTYLVQQRIPLATYQGNPFDLRVSVQKNETGNWQVTGIVGKVASKGLHVTNVARGGKVYPLEVLLEGKSVNKDEVIQAIEEFSIKTAEQISSKIDGLADLGLDIGITEEGFPMFIECNGRDLRITFRNANMEKVWKATHMTPLAYAKYLLDSSGKER